MNGATFEPGPLKPRLHDARHRHRTWTVAVHADRLRRERDRRTAEHRHQAGLQVADQTFGGGFGVVQHGAGPRARHELAVGLIGAVGEQLGVDRCAGGPRFLLQRATGDGEKCEVARYGAHRRDDGGGDRAICRCQIAERPVRLDVANFGTGQARDRHQCADLRRHQPADFVVGHRNDAPTEALAVVVAGWAPTTTPCLRASVSVWNIVSGSLA